VLVHDGIGVWLATRRLNADRFVWPREATVKISLTRAQFDALVLGLPWQLIGDAGIIKVRPIAIGRYNGLFAGNLRADKRAASVILIHSACMNGMTLTSILMACWSVSRRHPASRIEELLLHQWTAAQNNS
jgi:hypothetical protein